MSYALIEGYEIDTRGSEQYADGRSANGMDEMVDVNTIQ